MFAEFCDSCGDPIGIDVGQMAHGSQHWHANEKCFSCYNCGQTLLGQPFLPKNGEIFCSSGCSRGAPPPNPVNPKYPPRSASRNRTYRMPDNNNKDGYISSSTLSPEPIRKSFEIRSKASYRSSLDKYGLAAAEKLGDIFVQSSTPKKIGEQTIKEESDDKDESSSTCSSAASSRKELPSFPPSNRHHKKPVLRVPPSHRQKPTGPEIWIDMVPPKEATTHRKQEDDFDKRSLRSNRSTTSTKKYGGGDMMGHLNGNDTIERLVQGERQISRRHRRRKVDDSYFSDYEVERRKRTQRRQQTPLVYQMEDQKPNIPLMKVRTRSTESLDAGKARVSGRRDERDGKNKRTKSETNLSGSKSYKSKNDAVANLRLNIDVNSPKKQSAAYKKMDVVKKAPNKMTEDVSQKQSRSFGMFSAEDQRMTRINYVTQDDMANGSSETKKP